MTTVVDETDPEFKYDTVDMTDEEYERLRVSPVIPPVTPDFNINRLITSLTGVKETKREMLARIIADMGLEKLKELQFKWSFWARENQLPPVGFWTYWLLLAGRGFGKTRTGAEWVNEKVLRGESKRIALVAPTAADVRKTMVEGESGILAISPPWNRPHFEPSKLQLTWPNGAIAQMFSAEEPERLRGPQCDTFWADELCAWKNMQETWDMLMFGFRLGKNPQGCITTTPKPVPLLKEVLEDEIKAKNPDGTTIVTRGSTYDNKGNLAAPFFKKVVSKYEGTRLGRQELEAVILEDMPGALWVRADIDRTRIKLNVPPFGKFVVTDPDKGLVLLKVPGSPEPHTIEEWEELRKDSTQKAIWEDLQGRATSIMEACPESLALCVVGVDPNVSNEEKSDEIGITVGAKGLTTSKGYLLLDGSMKGSPNEWASTAILLYDLFSADRIVGEANQGGNMVEWTIASSAKFLKLQGLRTSDFVPIVLVHASRGKVTRAEPTSALYEQGRVCHVGLHKVLEDQMCLFTSDFDRKAMGYSPDRVDALVWTFTHIFNEGADTGILDFYAGQFMEQQAREEEKNNPSPDSLYKLKAPEGLSSAYGITGEKYTVMDGFVLVPEDELPGLRRAGFVEV